MVIGALIELLESRSEETLRLSFVDGEAYELTSFYLHLDDAQLPKASATVVSRIAAGAKTARHFAPGKVMMFTLAEAKTVAFSESTGGKLWTAT